MADLLLRICDVCNANEEERPSTHSINLRVNGKEYRLDFCEEHAEELWAPIERLLEGAVSVGKASAPAPAPVEGRLRCPDCGDLRGSLAALAQHRRATHGFIPYNPPRCPYCRETGFRDRQHLSGHITYLHRDEHLQRMITEKVAG